MTNIGIPALPMVYTYMNDPARREAGVNILRGMPTSVVKDYIIKLYASEDSRDTEQALQLLFERIRADEGISDPEKRMIPTLLKHVQLRSKENASRRIIASLLLFSKGNVLYYLGQVLAAQPYPQRWLAPVFLLLGIDGSEAKNTLLGLLKRGNNIGNLYPEVLGILGILDAHPHVEAQAISLGNISPQQSGKTPSPEQFQRAHHAIGGLFFGGKWNTEKLRELKHDAKEEYLRT